MDAKCRKGRAYGLHSGSDAGWLGVRVAPAQANDEREMYQPTLRPDQIRSLYQLRHRFRRPMTQLAREAVDHYLGRLSEAGDGQPEVAPDEITAGPQGS